jgi:hypothetical protein
MASSRSENAHQDQKMGQDHKMNHEGTKITKEHEEKRSDRRAPLSILVRTALVRGSSFVSFVSSWFIL